MYKNINVNMIVAVSANNCIGKNNELILTHREDFKRFKHLTKGNNILMGRKTWDSLPNKPLPDRNNFYIKKSDSWNNIDLIECFGNSQEGSFFLPEINCWGCDDMYGICEYMATHGRILGEVRDLWVIGGASVYEQFLKTDLVDEIHITRWNKRVDGDVFFPTLDESIWVRKFIEYPLTSADFVFETWVKNDID